MQFQRVVDLTTRSCCRENDVLLSTKFRSGVCAPRKVLCGLLFLSLPLYVFALSRLCEGGSSENVAELAFVGRWIGGIGGWR